MAAVRHGKAQIPEKKTLTKVIQPVKNKVIRALIKRALIKRTLIKKALHLSIKRQIILMSYSEGTLTTTL